MGRQRALFAIHDPTNHDTHTLLLRFGVLQARRDRLRLNTNLPADLRALEAYEEQMAIATPNHLRLAMRMTLCGYCPIRCSEYASPAAIDGGDRKWHRSWVVRDQRTPRGSPG